MKFTSLLTVTFAAFAQITAHAEPVTCQLSKETRVQGRFVRQELETKFMGDIAPGNAAQFIDYIDNDNTLVSVQISSRRYRKDEEGYKPKYFLQVVVTNEINQKNEVRATGRSESDHLPLRASTNLFYQNSHKGLWYYGYCVSTSKSTR